MSIKVEKTDNKNELKLEFTVAAEKFEDAMKKVYFQTAKYFNIPGFRKGKAPMKIVEKYYGESIFYEDAFNEILKEEYDKELRENDITAVSYPEFDIKQMEKGKDLIFTATVQVKPEVKLGKYKGIELKKVEYNVKDEDIDHELGHMQERNSRIVTVEDKPVEKGNIAVIDFEGFVDEKAFEGGKAEGYELEIGSNTFIPGFEDQIVGMKAGEEKDVKVKFPDEYFSKDLAGKDATFKVKVNEIKKKELPELDDDFAKDVSEFDTLKELKASIKEKLEKENEEKVKFETQDAAVKNVCDNTEIDIPSGMIDSEIDNMVNDMKSRLQYQGLTLDNYLKMVGKTEQEFRKDYEEQAKEAVKSRLVIEAIVKAEKIEADDKDITAKIEEMAKNYGREAKDLEENEALKNYIKGSLETEKAIEFVVKNAKIK